MRIVGFPNGLFGSKEKNAVLTIPNLVTLGGILLVFSYVVFYVYGANRWLIFSVLFLAGLSDLLDGFLARRLGQSTNLGIIIDLARDRLLLLAILGHITLLIGFRAQIAVIIFLETLIATLNIYGFLDSSVRSAHRVGKIRQLAHVFGGGIIVANNLFPEIIFMIYPPLGKISSDFLLMTMLIFSLLVAVVYSLLRVANNIRIRRIK